MPKAPPKIDSILRVVTPENIEFEYRLAGPFRRLPAYMLDLAIMGFILAFITFVIFLIMLLVGFAFPNVSFGFASAALTVSSFLLNWFFSGLCETFMSGQTPGKRLLGLRVLTETGEPIDAMQAILRNMIRLADVTIPIVGLGLMAMSRKYQRLGDMVCGTIVVVEERHWLMGLAKLEDPRAIQLAGFLPPNFVVSRSLSKAIATYVERRRFFTVPRRKEVARHLAKPLLELFGLPADTSYDLLLCALYYRTFIADSSDDERQLEAARVATSVLHSGSIPTLSPATYSSSAGAPLQAPVLLPSGLSPPAPVQTGWPGSSLPPPR